MKKMLLLFFAVLSLGFGHSVLEGMQGEKIDIFTATGMDFARVGLKNFTNDELISGIIELTQRQNVDKPAQRIQLLKREIDRRDPSTPYKIIFNGMPNLENLKKQGGASDRDLPGIEMWLHSRSTFATQPQPTSSAATATTTPGPQPSTQPGKKYFASTSKPDINRLLLDAKDVDTFDKIIDENGLSSKVTLQILINKAEGGNDLVEKIDHILDQFNRDTKFTDKDDETIIWKIISNYGRDEKIENDVARWVQWFIDHNAVVGKPHTGDDSAIDVAIQTNSPAVVSILLKHGQKPTDAAKAFARKYEFKKVLSALGENPAAKSTDPGVSQGWGTDTTNEEKLLQAENAAAMMDLLDASNIDKYFALTTLVMYSPDRGSDMEAKINALIGWYNANDKNIRFGGENIWQLVQNYAGDLVKIGSLPGWIDWFIAHGPHDANGRPIIKGSVDGTSVIDLATSKNDPAVVRQLLLYQQLSVPQPFASATAIQPQTTSITTPPSSVTTGGLGTGVTREKTTEELVTSEYRLLPDMPPKPSIPTAGTAPTTPTTTSTRWNFNALRNKGGVIAAISTGIAALLYGGARWYTSGSKAEHNGNVLINKTGTPVLVKDDKGNTIEPSPEDSTYALPETGSITVQLDDQLGDGSGASQTINLDRWTQYRKIDVLNITITKRRWVSPWLSKFISPLTYTTSWAKIGQK